MSIFHSKGTSSQKAFEACLRSRARAKPSLDWLPFGLTGIQFLILTAILAATALVYLRSLDNGFVFDDFPEIVRNRLLPTWGFFTESLKHDVWFFRDPDHLPQSNFYRPMQNLWLGLNWRLFHYHPAGWHLAKILLHLCVVTLAFRIAQLLTGSVPAALAAAGLFALLPVQVEAVAWITAIPEPLSALFMMGAFCLYIGGAHPRSSLRFWPLLLYACAAFTHESAMLFPALIAAYEWLLGGGEPSSGQDTLRTRISRVLKAVIPFAVVAIIYLGARAAVFGWSGIIGSNKQMVSQLSGLHLTWQMADTGHSGTEVLMTLPGAITEYLAVIVLPWLPGPAHPIYFVTVPAMSNFWLPTVILALLIAGGSWLLWHSPRRNLYVFGITWWAIMLAPALHLNSLFLPVADRYEYMPLFGWCLIGGDWFARVLQLGRLPRQAALAACAVVTIAMVVFSWHGQVVWYDDLTMFQRSVALAPADAQLHFQLAVVLYQRNDLIDSAEQLKQAIGYEPRNMSYHQLLARVYMRMGRRREAQREEDAVFDIIAPWHRNNPNLRAPEASGRPSPYGAPSPIASP